MLWDQFASLIWEMISCLDETFPWILSINWALKLLTRNSGLSCLKTLSGSWKHCRFLDLAKKLAFSIRLLTALFLCSGRVIQNNLCLSFVFNLCFIITLFFIAFVFPSLFSASLSVLSLRCLHLHFLYFLNFKSHLGMSWAQLRCHKAER